MAYRPVCFHSHKSARSGVPATGATTSSRQLRLQAEAFPNIFMARRWHLRTHGGISRTKSCSAEASIDISDAVSVSTKRGVFGTAAPVKLRLKHTSIEYDGSRRIDHGCRSDLSGPRPRPDRGRATDCIHARRRGARRPPLGVLPRAACAGRSPTGRRSGTLCGTSAASSAKSGRRSLADGDLMPGAPFFPDARLNFAENLLQTRDGRGHRLPRRGQGLGAAVAGASCVGPRLPPPAGVAAEGVRPGDRVAAMMPNLPETVALMLAAASLGAIVVLLLARFRRARRARPLRPDRAEAVLCVPTATGMPASASTSPTSCAAIAAPACQSSRRVVVVAYLGDAPRDRGRAAERRRPRRGFIAASQPRPLDFARLPFDHPLYILFSSGTTGVPKCIVHGGRRHAAAASQGASPALRLRPGDRVFYFTTCGWMMWNWLVSGLASGATLMLFDGSPFHPDANGPVRLRRARTDDAVRHLGEIHRRAAARPGFAPAATP